MRQDRNRREMNQPQSVQGLGMKPIGVAFAAVVAGLGAQAHEEAKAAPAHEPREPSGRAQAHRIDPTNHPGFEQDDSMILGPGEAVEPFAEAPAKRQGDLFEL